ncbi:hypothetical protein AURDEDRAFT_162115 [Auricularia subglabra TFB-10046 SS5]|nr:hypothetical protein AURDEDRAFT_162115 [Auricularia subglabra TFB-10046 SS5]
MYLCLIDLMRTPAPILADLRISTYDAVNRHPQTPTEFWHGFSTSPFPLFLPVALKLRELYVSRAAVMCRRPHPGLPSLRRLVLSLDHVHTVHLHDMLAISPNLKHLSLNVDEALLEGNALPGAPELALHLTKLEVRNGQLFDLLADGARLLLNLSHLVLHDVTQLSVAPALASRLTRLEIVYQENLHDYLVILRELKCVEHVCIGDGVSMRDDLFFAPLCDPQDPMWPNLKVLAFGHVELLSVDKDAVLRLLRAWNVEG